MQYALESRLQYAYDLNLLIPTRGQIGISHVIAWGAQLSLELIMVFMNSLGFYNYMDCMHLTSPRASQKNLKPYSWLKIIHYNIFINPITNKVNPNQDNKK